MNTSTELNKPNGSSQSQCSNYCIQKCNKNNAAHTSNWDLACTIKKTQKKKKKKKKKQKTQELILYMDPLRIEQYLHLIHDW